MRELTSSSDAGSDLIKLVSNWWFACCCCTSCFSFWRCNSACVSWNFCCAFSIAGLSWFSWPFNCVLSNDWPEEADADFPSPEDSQIFCLRCAASHLFLKLCHEFRKLMHAWHMRTDKRSPSLTLQRKGMKLIWCYKSWVHGVRSTVIEVECVHMKIDFN